MIWTLLIIMQFKHFIADYLLQGKYMLGKFKDKGWVLPLSAHCGVHFWFTSVISLFYLVPAGKSSLIALGLGTLDFIIHFIMDRIKASPKMLGRYQALSKKEMIHIMSYRPTLGEEGIKEKFGGQLRSNILFWWSLGLDQMVHHLTDILLIYLIIQNV